VFEANITVQVCLITQFRMGRSADYPQCVAISRMVKCGKGMVTWFSTSASHMHSTRAFRILLSVRILPEPFFECQTAHCPSPQSAEHKSP